LSDSEEHEEEAQEEHEEEAQVSAPIPSDVLYRRDLYWGPKHRPTHFLAIRLTDKTLLASLQAIYQQILNVEPSYADSLIPLERLHLTLGNLRLAPVPIDSRFTSPELDHTGCSSTSAFVTDAAPSASDSMKIDSILQYKSALNVDQVIEILGRLGVELSHTASQLSIKLVEFGEFFNSTLYAKLVDEYGLLRSWVEGLHTRLREEGIVLAEVFDFNPHVTLLKITRSMAFKLRTPYIDGRILPMLEGVNIVGEQRLSVSGIQLCKKSSRFGYDGFYITPAYISLEQQ